MKLKLVNIIWLACVVAIAALSISAIVHKRDTPMTGVDVRIQQFDGGEYFLSTEDVMRELDAILETEITSINLRDLNTLEIEESLRNNPFISNVEVYVSSDGILGVTVYQREPVLRVFDKDGSTYYLDITGERIPVSPYFTARVMVATGWVGRQLEMDNSREDSDPNENTLVDLASAIDSDPFLRSLTEQLEISATGEITLIPKAGEFRFRLGNLERIPDKLENIKAVYAQVLEAEGWNKYREFDLAYDGQVVGKVKP